MGQVFTKGDIHDHYIIYEKPLGKGTYGTVHEGVHKVTKKSSAIKVLKKDRFKNDKLREKVRREIDLMKAMEHPYCINLEEVFVSNRFVFICMELCTGGDLLQFLNERGRPLSELRSKRYVGQVVDALKYLHEDQKIVHRDLKPENLLLTADKRTIKLADFGLSNQLTKEDNIFWTMCGSLNHIAPEVFDNKGYDFRVDVWALGIVLFVMLSVSYPFDDPIREKAVKKIKEGKLSFEATDPIWKRVSMEAKDLIQLILNTEAENRITLDEIWEHPWMPDKKKSMYSPKKEDEIADTPKGDIKRVTMPRSVSKALFKHQAPTPEELEELKFEKGQAGSTDVKG